MDVARVLHTCALCTISSITGRTRSTLITSSIGWRRKINALNASVTRLAIHLAGVNVTITKPSCVASLTFASHENKLAVSVDRVLFFWLYTLTTMMACAHVNGRTPGCASAFVISSNKRQIKLKTKQVYDSIVFCFMFCFCSFFSLCIYKSLIISEPLVVCLPSVLM